MTMPVDTRTIPNVPLIHVGEHEASTGPWDVTPEDLRSIVEAHAAGIVRPVIKLGHEGPLRDAGPALGTVTDLAIINGGRTLVGTFTGVPRAIANLLPHAYPQRSVECLLDYTDTTGHAWPVVLSAVALLGATAPAVKELDSLADVAALYGVDLAATAGPSERRVVIASAAPDPSADRARAVAVARARRTRNTRTVSHERTPA
ncbi:hypothetical protein MHOL44478_23420 [Mycobacterium holsaticum DSM 44478]|nr:hypothetical protein [Mycolicibacterium holsaticum DSM 44478 = JCM 12374]